MSELPEGWAETTIGEVAESMKNGLYKPVNAYADDGVACLRMYNIDEGKIIWKNIKRMKLSSAEIEDYRLLTGDVLVNRVNSRELVGKSAVISDGLETCVFESKNIRVRFRREVVCPELVNYALFLGGQRYFTSNAQQVVGMASISQPQIAAFPLRLPPLNEQRRIVAKLKKLLGRVDAVQARLATIPRILKRFRQSVLAAACSGRLTADWREQNSNTASAFGMIQLILEYRRAVWEASQLERMKAKGKALKDDKWKREYPEPNTVNVNDLPELPESWAWIKLGMLGQDPLNTVQTGPFGALLHNSEFKETGVPVVAVGNLTGMGFSTDGLYFVSNERPKN